MRNILCTKSVVMNSGITGINDINSLADGSLAIFTGENGLVATPPTAADLSDQSHVWFAVGNTSNGVLKSMLIPRTGIIVEKKAYVAPVKKIVVIGAEDVAGNSPSGVLALPSTLVAGTIASIKVIDTTSGVFPQDSKRYETTVIDGDTNTTLLTRLIAVVNADSSRLVNAALVDTNKGIKLTAIDYYKDFQVARGGVLASATIVSAERSGVATVITDTPPMKIGFGAGAQIVQLEKDLLGYLGSSGNLFMPTEFFSYVNTAVAATNYDVYSFTWTTVKNGVFGAKNVNKIEFLLAIPTGDATMTQANLETALGVIFNPADAGDLLETGV